MRVDKQMRASVILEPGVVRIRDVARPNPGPDELLIRLEGCGVCASSLPVWGGRPWFNYPQPPGAPGHEGWGRVAAVGTAVKGLREGDRVAALTYRAHAEYDLAQGDQAAVLPAALDALPVPGEPLGCAMNIFGRSGIEVGQTVAIVGIGFLGALLTGLAADAGARVVAIARRGYALDIAKQMGASELIVLDDPALVLDRVRELTQGAWCERVIEAVGLQGTLDLAAELTGVRGRLVIAGYHQDGLRQVNLQQWNWRGFDVVNAHEREPQRYLDGIRQAIERMADGALDAAPLFTHQFRLEELGAALDMSEQRPDGFMKAWVTP